MKDRDPGPGTRETYVSGAPARATEAQLKRLRWRARRGTRELDALLGAWLDRNANDTNTTGLQAFAALLDQQDPEIWDWLMGHAEPPCAEWRAIVADIRTHAGLAR
ncbi:MAG: succinate dehydrogenase assembly factor 2 [Rhodanobacteraceae bacterium]